MSTGSERDTMRLVADNRFCFESSWRTPDGAGGGKTITFFDLGTLLRNLAMAGALHAAYASGRSDGVDDGRFLASTVGGFGL